MNDDDDDDSDMIVVDSTEVAYGRIDSQLLKFVFQQFPNSKPVYSASILSL